MKKILFIAALLGGIMSFAFTTEREEAKDLNCPSPPPNLTIIKVYSESEFEPYESYFTEFSDVTGMALGYEQSSIYLQVTGTLTQGGIGVTAAPAGTCGDCFVSCAPFLCPGIPIVGCYACFLDNQVDPSQIQNVPLPAIISVLPNFP